MNTSNGTAGSIAGHQLRKRNQRSHQRSEQRRQTILANIKSVGALDEEDDPSMVAGVASGSGDPSGRKGSFDDAYQTQAQKTMVRLKSVLKTAAAKAVDHTHKVMNPEKPSLADVARMYLQDAGDSVAGRALLPKEVEFVRDAHAASVHVNKVQETFKDVDGAIQRRLQAIETRRRQQAEQLVAMETEHVTYSEYQKYMRKKGYLRDDREDVPEGNLIPILAVLQGQAEGVGFIKGQRKLVRIGDFVVEVDPNDPLFARYGNDPDAEAEEARRNFQLHRNGKFKDAHAQTEDRDDDATDAEIAFVYRRLDEAQNVIEAMDKSKLEAELFCETALSRIVGLRNAATKMYDTLETGQATLTRLTAEAMSQNERLWKKLEAVAQDASDDRAKRNVQRTFTQQIDRLSSLNASLKLRIESMEATQMQLCGDYHYQESVHMMRMDELLRQIVPRAVRDALTKLHQHVERQSNEEPGGAVHTHVRDAIYTKQEVLIHAASHPTAKKSASGEPMPTPPPFELKIPSAATQALSSTVESTFATLDEVARQTQRCAHEMVMNPHQPNLVVERLSELGDLCDELRRVAQGIATDFADTLLTNIFQVQQEQNTKVLGLEQELAAKATAHQEELARQKETLTRQFQASMNGALSMEQFEREKGRAVAKEKERFLQQLGKEIPIPQLFIPSLSATFPVPKPLTAGQTASAQPQDLLHAAASYVSEMVMEMCQVCVVTNQRPPPRLSMAGTALQWIKLAQEKVSSYEGIVDGIAANIPGATQAILPAPAASAKSSSSVAKAASAESVALAQRWWETSGGTQSESLSTGSTPQRNALELAASILGNSTHFSSTNLNIRTKMAELARAPDHLITATINTAKETAKALRSSGTIAGPMVAAGATDPQKPADPASGAAQSAKGSKGGGGAATGGGRKSSVSKPLPEGGEDTHADGGGATTIPIQRVRPPTTDRATSPIAKFKGHDAVGGGGGTKGSAKDGPRQQVAKQFIEEKAATKAREELSTTLSSQYHEMHAAIEYLRISLMHAFGVPTDEEHQALEAASSVTMEHSTAQQLNSAPSMKNIAAISGDVSRLFALQVREDREVLDQLTSMLLFSTEDGLLERARTRYRTKAPKLGVRSRVQMFLSTGVDKGTTCDLISGREAIMASTEAMDYAVHYDMRVISTKRRLLQQSRRDRLKFEAEDAVSMPLPSNDSASQMALSPTPREGVSLPPLANKGKSNVGLVARDDFDVDPISVRRIVHSNSGPPLSKTPQPHGTAKIGCSGAMRSDAQRCAPSQAAYQRGKQMELEWTQM